MYKGRFRGLLAALLVAGLVMAGGLVSVGPVYAQCGDGTPGDDTIVCDGVDPDGVTGLTGTDSVQVLPGASVEGPVLVDGGDTINVAAGGSITNSASMSAGIQSSPQGGTTVNNAGTIATTGDNNASVLVTSGGNTVNNTGTISASGSPSFGVFASGDGNTIQNDGTINSTGDDGVGVWVIGDDNTVTNNGTISTSGDDAEGIYSQGSNTIVNNGTITTTGTTDSEGIAAYDGDNTVINNGTIQTSDPAATGIDMANGMTSGNDTVINNGDIITNGASAINTGAGNDTVIINGGHITGLIDGGPGTDAITFSAEVGAEQYAALAEQIAAANPNGGTITLNGETYTWANFEELLGLLQLAMFHDTRVNPLDFGATAVGYCETDGLSVYGIVGGSGEWAFLASHSAVQAALASAAADGAHVLIGEQADLGVSLWALVSNELQLMGPAGYVFIFPASTCGLG